MDVDKQALRERAESTIGILENIAGFEPSDIDGDSVELRFETEGGFDTGCDVSIVDQCQKAADVIRALLDDLEAAEKRNVELSMLLEGADAIQTDYAEALECQDDNDSVLAAIVALKQRAESAEKRIADYHRALNNLAAVARRYLPDYDEHPDIQAADDLLESAAGIKWEAE